MERKNTLKPMIIQYAIINYRLSMKSVYELFNIENTDDVIKLYNNSITRNTIRYVLNHETINDSEDIQKKAKNKTFSLFSKLKNAKSKQEIINLLTSEEDKKALLLINRDARTLSEEEKECLFSYRYRHALKIKDMTQIFPFYKNFYIDNEKKISNEDLKEKLSELNKYYLRLNETYHPKI